jgi:hypothetical protein
MAAEPVMTAERSLEEMRNAAPPSEDDVTVLWDGRRIDCREAAMQWLAELEAQRAEDSALSDGAA